MPSPYHPFTSNSSSSPLNRPSFPFFLFCGVQACQGSELVPRFFPSQSSKTCQHPLPPVVSGLHTIFHWCLPILSPLGHLSKTNYSKRPWLYMTRTPLTAGIMLPKLWVGNLQRKWRGTMRFSSRMSGKLSLAEFHSLITGQVETATKALVTKHEVMLSSQLVFLVSSIIVMLLLRLMSYTSIKASFKPGYRQRRFLIFQDKFHGNGQSNSAPSFA